MTPGGRVQAAIDILELVLSPPDGREHVPADVVVSGYTRKRRFIGSKDRRALTGMVWTALRYRALAQWRLDQDDIGARTLMIATLAGSMRWSAEEIGAAFDGSTYGPPALAPEESAMIASVAGSADSLDGAPAAAIAGMPEWLGREVGDVLDDDDRAAWQALSTPAPTVLRVNRLKADRQGCLAALREAAIEAAPTEISPLGIRLAGRVNLDTVPPMREGWLDVQDEGSQIAAALVDAKPGMRVLDYCAGGGGKALALAAVMANEGAVVATDTDAARLKPVSGRARKAGALIIDPRPIQAGETVDAGSFDRVLVDAPCSGSGAWRRRPEAPWRLTPKSYADLQQTQLAVLTAAAKSVKPGGRLIYVTCSVFPAENDAIVRRFAEDHADFAPLDAEPVWRDAVDSDAPAMVADANIVRLLPHRTGTDGFFIALFERSGT